LEKLKQYGDFMKTRTTFSSDPGLRKQAALMWVLRYFPDALAAVGQVILKGQTQHNTHGWDRDKSMDHEEAMLRHAVDAGYLDVDGVPHSAKVAWRALALLQLELETELGLLMSPASYSAKQNGVPQPDTAAPTPIQLSPFPGEYTFLYTDSSRRARSEDL
jgi:hypothetical protein